MSNLAIATEIKRQLMGLGLQKVWSWGANTWAGGENFLTFKVQGFKLKGRVTITLNSMDLYDIDFINKKNEVIKRVEGVYFDEMVDVIDHNVETENGKYTAEQEKIIGKGMGSLFN